MVKDEYVRTMAGASTRFGEAKSDTAPHNFSSPTRRHGEDQGETSSRSPTRRHGEDQGETSSRSPTRRHGEDQGDGSSSSSSTPVNSVPIGTEPPAGDSRPPDAVMTSIKRRKSDAWKGAKSLLNAHGMPKAQTGAYIAKLATEYGADTVLDVLEAAVLERPAEPDAWMRAACQRRTGQRSSPKSFAERDRDAGMQRWEQMTGRVHPDRSKATTVIDITPAAPALEGKIGRAHV